MPLSSEQRRRPSCCCQQRAGSRRFDISESRYPEQSRTMAALGRRSWPFQPRMKVQRMRRWRPSLREFFSWHSPIVMRPTSDERQMGSAGKRSLPTARNKVEQIDLHQRQIQSLRGPIIWCGRESWRSDWMRHCCHEADKADAEKEAHRRQPRMLKILESNPKMRCCDVADNGEMGSCEEGRDRLGCRT